MKIQCGQKVLPNDKVLVRVNERSILSKTIQTTTQFKLVPNRIEGITEGRRMTRQEYALMIV